MKNTGPAHYILRNKRKQKGITAAHVAKVLKVSRSYLSDMELGKREMSPERRKQYDEAIK